MFELAASKATCARGWRTRTMDINCSHTLRVRQAAQAAELAPELAGQLRAQELGAAFGGGGEKSAAEAQ